MRHCSMALYIPTALQRIFVALISLLDKEGCVLHELIVSIAKSGLLVYYLFR